jgi:hypothetical protein
VAAAFVGMWPPWEPSGFKTADEFLNRPAMPCCSSPSVALRDGVQLGIVEGLCLIPSQRFSRDTQPELLLRLQIGPSDGDEMVSVCLRKSCRVWMRSQPVRQRDILQERSTQHRGLSPMAGLREEDRGLIGEKRARQDLQ